MQERCQRTHPATAVVYDFGTACAKVATGFGKKVAAALIAIMKNIHLGTQGVSFGNTRVLLGLAEAQPVVAVEAHQTVRIPATAAHPAAADIVAAAERESVVGGVVEVERIDVIHHFGCEALVGIEAQHP